jgi:heat shock protein HtpX
MLMVAIVFTGIFSVLGQILFAGLSGGSGRRRKSSKSKGRGNKFIIVVISLIGFLLFLFGYFVAKVIQLSISRDREYRADAGSAEMTKNSLALASALRKIAANPCLEAIQLADISYLCIERTVKNADSSKQKK